MRILLAVLITLLSQFSNTMYYDDRGADFVPWIRHGLTEIRKELLPRQPNVGRARAGHAAVGLSLNRAGIVTKDELLISSDVAELDALALETLRAVRFQSLPADYPGDEFDIIFVFWFNERPFDVYAQQTVSEPQRLDLRMLRAAANGDERSVRQLLNSSASKESKDESGRTALILAAMGGHLGVARALLESDLDLGARALNGWDALAFAEASGHTDIVDLLVAHGAQWSDVPLDEPERSEFAASVDTRPSLPVEPPFPPYPERALRNGIAGEVVLMVRVGPDGSTEILSVLKPLLFCTEEAMTHARGLRWIPAQKDSQPVEAVEIVTVRFESPQRN